MKDLRANRSNAGAPDTCEHTPLKRRTMYCCHFYLRNRLNQQPVASLLPVCLTKPAYRRQYKHTAAIASAVVTSHLAIGFSM